MKFNKREEFLFYLILVTFLLFVSSKTFSFTEIISNTKFHYN